MAPKAATALREANERSRSKIVSLCPWDLHSRNRCAQDGIGRAGILQSKEESRAWCAHPVVHSHGKQPLCLHQGLIEEGVGSHCDLAPHGRTCEAESFDFLIRFEAIHLTKTLTRSRSSPVQPPFNISISVIRSKSPLLY